jgi:putative chitinase
VLKLQNLKNQWMHADVHNPGLVEGMAASAADVFSRYGVNSDLVIAHLMAQMSVETGGGVALIENLGAYTAPRLLQIFPKYFVPSSLAQQAAGHEVMVGQVAYGGRLGNDKAPSTDGFIFRGAGLIQLTGKQWRIDLQKTLDANGAQFNLVTTPGALVDPATALECAVAFFVNKGCVSFAQKDCGDYVSYKVNGGTNGILQRRQQLTVWKRELGVAPLATPGPCPPVPGAPPLSS